MDSKKVGSFISSMRKQKSLTQKELAEKLNVTNLIITMIFIVSVLSSCICLLCNYLINNKFNWSLYVVGAFIVLLAIIIPIFKLKRFRAEVSLGGFTITLIPYLFLIQYLAPIKGWAIPLALPIVILSILALGISLFIWFYTKMNKLYSAAIIVLLFGVAYEIWVQKIIENFIGRSGANEISMVATVLSSIVIAAILAALGHKI